MISRSILLQNQIENVASSTTVSELALTFPNPFQYGFYDWVPTRTVPTILFLTNDLQDNTVASPIYKTQTTLELQARRHHFSTFLCVDTQKQHDTDCNVSFHNNILNCLIGNQLEMIRVFKLRPTITKL